MLLHVDSPLEWMGSVTVTIGLPMGGLIYTAGWRRSRCRLPGRYAGSQLAAFLGGLACLWVAIASPLDEAADTLLSAHMVQHFLLLTVAPALLLLGDPLLPLLRGLPYSLRRTVVAPLRWRSLQRALHALTHPLVALLLSSLALWTWHSPTLYQLALRVPAIHLLEHALFFVAGVLFWYPVVQPWPSRPRWPSGAMIPYLVIADVQNTLLAAVFTFSDRVLYPIYALRDRAAEAAALDDQVLAGVIMWVPMSLAYLVPAVLLTLRLLSPATRDRRMAGHLIIHLRQPGGVVRTWILASALWGVCTPLFAVSGQGPASAVESNARSVLRSAAQNGTLAGLRWPRFPYYRDELTSLYTASEWRPVWTANGVPITAARQAIDVLRTAQDRGLSPDDYDVALLDEEYRKLATGAASSARDVGRFDVMLSVALMRHLSDVHIGRVNPKNLSVEINVEPKKLDLARVVSDAIASGRIADVVRNAEPRFVQYRNLITAYARYRAIAADNTLRGVVARRGAVRVGEQFDGVAALRRRLLAFGDLAPSVNSSPSGAIYDAVTSAGVARFQSRNGLPVDSVLSEATLAAINVSPAKRARQLELALERIRWLPALGDGPFIVANVPSFQLYAFDSVGGAGVPTIQMNVVVGKADVGRQTPIFEHSMSYIIFRPYWVITPNIIRKETLPAVRRDRGYLERNDMEVYSGSGDTGPALPATSANLARVASGGLGIRQRPGPRNSLGLAKFIFPNDHNVYFHGTPATELFARSRRDFSHGCIRLEDPAGLATWILRDPNNWSHQQVEQVMNGDTSRRLNLARNIPVVIYYTTAVVWPDGQVGFFDDVYKHDARLERALAKGP